MTLQFPPSVAEKSARRSVQKACQYWQVRNPELSVLQIANYMAADKSRKNTVLQNCKFVPQGRQLQFKEAQFAIGMHLRGGGQRRNLVRITSLLRERSAHDAFSRNLYDFNADCIETFVNRVKPNAIPQCEYLAFSDSHPLYLEGVKATTDIALGLRRVTRTGRTRVGGAAFHFSAGKFLNSEVARWHSAFLHGYYRQVWQGEDAEPDPGLCLTIDISSGRVFEAPTNSITRFTEIKAACAEISRVWDAVEPPVDAVPYRTLIDSDLPIRPMAIAV